MGPAQLQTPGSSPSTSPTADGSGALAHLLGLSAVPPLLVLVSCAREKPSSQQARGHNISFSCSALEGVLLPATSKLEAAEPAGPPSGERCFHAARGETRKGMNWGLTLPVSQPGWPRSWPPSGGKGGQEAGGARGPCPAMTAPPQLPHCSSPPELSEITASNSKFKLLQRITINGFLHLINARRI